MKLKFIIKKILYSYKSSSKTYVDYLRNIGVLCGDNINMTGSVTEFKSYEDFIDYCNEDIVINKKCYLIIL